MYAPTNHVHIYMCVCAYIPVCIHQYIEMVDSVLAFVGWKLAALEDPSQLQG